MLKKKYIKRAYIVEAYCDNCGADLCPTGIAICTSPLKYEYRCTNCRAQVFFREGSEPGKIQYEFEEEEDV